ncbi:universal stress protein [Streptomyces sp. NPDC057806]|uniref:universal stress protein n=2 Tax=unclassified Streptomyces TaxID=2593676 RepID=UPI0036B76A6E
MQRKRELLMSYEHLLVAVEPNESAVPVIKRAGELAEPTRAKISLVAVVQPLLAAFGTGTALASAIDPSQRPQDQSDQGKEILEPLLKKFPDVNGAGCHVVYGDPRKEVYELAKKEKCDLIVFDRDGHYGELLGSSANGTSHGAPCEVLAV